MSDTVTKDDKVRNAPESEICIRCMVEVRERLDTVLWASSGARLLKAQLKTNPLQRTDMDEFVACYHAENRHARRPTWSESTPNSRWRAFDYDEIVKRDKCSLDIFWLRDDSLEDSDNLPPPEVIAAEIVEDLEAALEQFAEIQADLTRRS